MEYPKFERLAVTVLPHHIEWLNRRFYDAGINRSVSAREALELLIAKYDDAGGVASKSSEVSDDDDAIAPRGESSEREQFRGKGELE